MLSSACHPELTSHPPNLLHQPRQRPMQLAPGGVGWAVNERQSEALIRAREALQRVQASIAGGQQQMGGGAGPWAAGAGSLVAPVHGSRESAAGCHGCLRSRGACCACAPAEMGSQSRHVCVLLLQTSCPWISGRLTCGPRCWRWVK